jgi:serine/threonine protein phosphatase 1
VIPDIHGRYDLLSQALNYIYDKETSGGKIIFLGDYIDRGTQNVDVLLTVMNPPDGWEFITLKGNHEQIFHAAYDRQCDYYDMKAVREIIDDDRIELTKVVSWFENLPLVHKIGDNIFAHAFYDVNRNFDEQRELDVIWLRFRDPEAFYNDRGWYLTHGHTPRKNGPITAINRCNLDCGAAHYGRLVIGEYEEDIKGPVNFIEFEG